jgi:outer membrane receptor for ferrienterochelin and colicin
MHIALALLLASDPGQANAPPSPTEPSPLAAADAPSVADDVADADEDLFALETEMVTAASRVSEPVRRAPASVTLVTERELRAFGYQSVADALLGVRGTYQTNDRFYQSLGVRGFNRFGDYGNRLQVQMDGHVMNDDWNFSSYIGNDQFSDIRHVQSIEVVRGPGSALYGTGAFFGVVNIVTPRAAPTYSVRGAGGLVDTNTWRLHVDGGHQFTNEDGSAGPGFWASVSSSYLVPQDYFSPAYVGTPWAPDGVAHGTDAFSTMSGAARAWWGDFTLEVSGHERNRRVPTGHFESTFGDIRNMADDDRSYGELRWEPKIDANTTLLSRVYVDHQRYQGHYADDNPDLSMSSEDYSSTWVGVEARVQLLPLGTESLKTTVGAQYELHPVSHWTGKDRPELDPYLDQSATFQYLSAYALADWTPFESLLVTGGARFDGWLIGSGSGVAYGAENQSSLGFLWSLNPRAAVIWMPTDEDTLKLMGGTAYRIPSIYELTYSPVGLSFEDGPALDSERIYAAELEYRRRLPLDVLAVGSVYTNVVTDLINYVVGGEGGNLDGYDNVDDVLYTAGAEVELRAELPGDILAAAQYSFQQTSADGFFSEERIANSPTHIGAAWLILPLAGRELQLANRFVVEGGRLDRNFKDIEPAPQWDVMLTGDLTEYPIGFTVGFKNVLDARIEHPVSDRVRDVRLLQDGRTLRAELVAHF